MCSTPGTAIETTRARTFSARLEKPSHSGLRPPVEGDPEGGKRAGGREKGGKHRSTTVAHGHQRSLENWA